MKVKGSLENNDLVDLLICPSTGSPLVFDDRLNLLVSTKGGFAFPVVDGIPVLVISKSVELKKSDGFS